MSVLAGVPVSSLNFTANCTGVGLLFGSPDTAADSDVGKPQPEFIRLALPDQYRDNVTTAELQDYIDNYLFQPAGDFTPAMNGATMERAKRTCWRNICNTAYAKFAGQSDTGGIGMIVAYFLETILFTTFAILHMIETSNISKYRTVRTIFFDTCIAFSLPVSVASMVFLVTAKTLYEVSFIALIPIIAAIPTLPIACSMWKHAPPGAAIGGETRENFRHALAVICTILACTVASAAGILAASSGERYPDHTCESPLFKSRHFFYVVGVFPYSYTLASLVGLRFWFGRVKKSNPPDTPPVENGPSETAAEVIKPAQWRWNNATKKLHIVISLVWGAVGLAIITTMKVGIKQMAGREAYAEDVWTFGQIVAVFLWLPVLLEGGYLIFGPSFSKQILDRIEQQRQRGKE